MSDYTPTIGEIRALYVRETARGESRNLGELIAEFDRWLAAHDSKVRAEEREKADREPSDDPCSCPSGDGSLRHPCQAHPGDTSDREG